MPASHSPAKPASINGGPAPVKGSSRKGSEGSRHPPLRGKPLTIASSSSATVASAVTPTAPPPPPTIAAAAVLGSRSTCGEARRWRVAEVLEVLQLLMEAHCVGTDLLHAMPK
jgi:hypothetical protein